MNQLENCRFKHPTPKNQDKENLQAKSIKQKPSAEKFINFNKQSAKGIKNGKEYSKVDSESKVQHAKPYNANMCKLAAPRNSKYRVESSESRYLVGENRSLVKKQILKFPRITKEDTYVQQPGRKNCRSFKKIVTKHFQSISEHHMTTETLSPKPSEGIKQVLMGIVKSKQKGHFLSLDDQIDKWYNLTKRYECLRKELSSIQQDILTINLKQKCKHFKQNTSLSSEMM